MRPLPNKRLIEIKKKKKIKVKCQAPAKDQIQVAKEITLHSYNKAFRVTLILVRVSKVLVQPTQSNSRKPVL
jgi:hypothetical protein